MKQQKGFTIVELLIVIVVIGILAAITIVAYNGVQNKARATTALNASSDAAKKVEVFAADGAGYPATLAAAGVVDGNSTYQYTVNNAVTPATYCLTATYATASYMMSSGNNVPTAGACPGHGVGGVAPITNLVTNPSIETGTSTYGIGGLAVASSTDWASNGTYSLKLTPTGATSDSYTNIGGDTGAVRLGMQAGSTYTVSASINLMAAQTGAQQPNRARTIRLFTKVGAGAYVESGPSQAPNSAGVTRLTYTFTVPAGVTEAFIRLYNGSISTTDLVYWDSIMLTTGPSTYNYADGATANWVWNGTANSSTSTGPPV